MGMQISGFDELFKNIEKLGKSVDGAKKKALTQGAEIIRQKMVDNAPEDTGQLKSNIITTEPQTNENGESFVDVGPDKDAFYAKFHEFGTTKMKPKPFIEPAYLEKRNEATAKIAEVLRGEINNV